MNPLIALPVMTSSFLEALLGKRCGNISSRIFVNDASNMPLTDRPELNRKSHTCMSAYMPLPKPVSTRIRAAKARTSLSFSDIPLT